jgi:hypothetical protein
MNLKVLRAQHRKVQTGEPPIEKLKELVKKSGFFKESWYLARNPDICAAGVDPLDHFCRYGDRELRLPGPLFDSRTYVATWSDVAASGMGPPFLLLDAGGGFYFHDRIADYFSTDRRAVSAGVQN